MHSEINSGLCHLEQQNEINKKILERNISMCDRENPVSFRSEPTKFTFPVITNNRSIYCSNIDTMKFKNESCFDNYSRYVNHESVLRNQIYALQRSPQAAYIPNSSSDLYNNKISNDNNKLKTGNEQLNYSSIIDTTIFNDLGDYFSIFNNHTRQEIKD